MGDSPFGGFRVIPVEVWRIAVRRCQSCGLPAHEFIDRQSPNAVMWWQLFIGLATRELEEKRLKDVP